ncbi:MAG: hypothetical protein ABJO01_10505 [Parasphingorhabdus sp.]|uniref:hypothetical protein n=1 Tax=Parasphingorhabdus sp. TaxID=2709688 RepID=UPI00329757E0
MVELKILLILMIWPDGQDQANPIWTGEPFATVAECENYAALIIADAVEKYGTNVASQFHCLNKDSRIQE